MTHDTGIPMRVKLALLRTVPLPFVWGMYGSDYSSGTSTSTGQSQKPVPVRVPKKISTSTSTGKSQTYQM
eukprot:scaffold77565_cov29-Prasinocladus_malaysianus.AAC.1